MVVTPWTSRASPQCTLRSSPVYPSPNGMVLEGKENLGTGGEAWVKALARMVPQDPRTGFQGKKSEGH